MIKKFAAPPSWSLASAYPSIQSKEFTDDISWVEENIPKIHVFAIKLSELNLESEHCVNALVQIFLLRARCENVVHNLFVFVNALNSVDTTLLDVQAMESRINELQSRLQQATKPLDSFLASVSETFLQKLLSLPELKAFSFEWRHHRKLKDHLLSDAEESLLEGLEVSGHTAWMNLYYQLVGSMKCKLELKGGEQVLGLSEASALLYGSSEDERKSAWQAIQKTWQENQVTAASIVNALAGWRIEVSKKRSHVQPMTFLAQALHDNRIELETLEAIITCCRQNLPQLRRAPIAMAKMAGKEKLDPWDLVASCPAIVDQNSSLRSYEDGFTLIHQSFAALSSEMANFAQLMNKNSWIDAKPLSTKSTGGFCFEFSKPREPRIFMTYQGSANHITTLAHELGHAYHYWVMRGIDRAEAHYPSTLAEAASVFAEQALRDQLEICAKTKTEKMEAAWSELESITGYLIDIPCRFEFEKKFHEIREKQTLSAVELSALMEETRRSWFGDTFSAESPLYWATKLHFSSSGSGFYNFPYAFGYLFAQSLYARRKEQGESFNSTYIAILRDTGRMTAEDLVQKHLGEDIRKPEFWQKSIDLALKKIAAFE